MSSDRAAVAREVLTEAMALVQEHGCEALADEIHNVREQHYPAAPETVSVDGLTWTLGDDGWWDRWLGQTRYAYSPRCEMGKLLHRIASDARVLAELRDENTQLKREVDWATERASSARIAANTFERERDRATADRDAGLRVLEEREARIAELEKEVAHQTDMANQADVACSVAVRDRDAALRALEEKGQQERLAAVAPSPKASGDTQGSPPAPVVPAPIPLGAVVEVEGHSWSPFRRIDGGWLDKDNDRWADSDATGKFLTALYHARHPVATRETVERVALDAWRDVGKVELRHVRQIVDHTYKAAGFTLEGA